MHLAQYPNAFVSSEGMAASLRRRTRACKTSYPPKRNSFVKKRLSAKTSFAVEMPRYGNRGKVQPRLSHGLHSAWKSAKDAGFPHSHSDGYGGYLLTAESNIKK